MSRITGLVVSLALVGALAAVEPVAVATPVAATSAWIMPAEDRAAINQLLELAIAHGFPDASGAVLYQGTLNIVRPKEGRQSRRHGKFPQPDGSTDDHGLHLRFPDGTWLAGMTDMVPPATGVVVREDNVVAIPLTDLLATLTKRSDKINGLDESIRQLIALYPTEQRDLVRAALAWLPLLTTMPSMRDPNTAIPTIMHLVRLGVTGSERLVMLMSLMSKELLTGNEPNLPVLLLTTADRERRVYRAGGPSRMTYPRTAPAVVPNTRQLFAHWFKRHLVSLPATGQSRLNSDQAIAGMLAFGGDLSPIEREQQRLLRELSMLPTVLPTGATMAMRVALYDPQQPVGQDHGQSARFRLDDLGDLIALVGEDGPSRWLNGSDFGDGPYIPRTLGDNALRILAALLGIDPRRLVRLDPGRDWSPAARAETAKALQAWWATRDETGLNGLLARAVTTLDPDHAAALVAKVTMPAITTTLIEHWRTTPPLSASAAVLASALTELKYEASLTELVRTWPVAGEHQLLLATWHACHGEQRYLDERFAAALATPTAALDMFGRSTGDLALVLSIADKVPSPARINATLTALAGPLDGAAAHVILQLALHWLFVDNPANYLAQHLNYPAGDTMRRVLQVALLNDTRPLPEGLFQAKDNSLILKQGDQHTTLPFGSAGKPLTLPASARMCDIAALCASKISWRWGIRDGKPTFDLTLPVADRDAAIAIIREQVAASAQKLLEEANLPLTLLPAAAATPSDPKALF